MRHNSNWLNIIAISCGVVILLSTLISQESSILIQSTWIIIAIIWMVLDILK